MIKFSLKGGNTLKKVLNKPFYSFSVSAILTFILLLVYYPLWVALFNSLVIVIVGFLLNIAVKKINHNRSRYFPSGFSSLIWFFGFIIMINVEDNVSLIEILWITVFVVFILSIIFPALPKKMRGFLF